MKRHPALFGTAAFLVTTVIIYLFLQANLEQVSRSIVLKATQGAYRLEMDNLKLSLLKGKIEIVNGVIFSTDTTNSGDQFRMLMPSVFIKTKSWLQLVNGRFEIDSISITRPELSIYSDTHKIQTGKPGPESSQEFAELKYAMNFLHIRSFNLSGGTLKIFTGNDPEPITSTGIAIQGESYGNTVGEDGTFHPTTELNISMPAQKWILNDGKLQIQIKSLEFIASSQYLEIDSFSLQHLSSGGTDSVQLQVASIGFKSSASNIFFENEALAFDSVWSVKPSLKLHFANPNTVTDTASGIFGLLKSLPYRFTANHLDVQDGQFDMYAEQADKTVSHHTESLNLKADQIVINPAGPTVFSTGPVMLNAQNLTFYTPDSLYALTLREFEISDNNIRLLNADFRPTPFNKDQSINAFINEILIDDINLAELLEQRIAASRAVLSSPVISISNPKSAKISLGVQHNLPVFYDALKGLSRLIAVKNLVIADATLHYSSAQPSPVDAHVTGLHVELQLLEFLKVRDLMKAKKFITLMEAGQILVNAGNLHVGLDRLTVQRDLQHNHIGAIQIRVDNTLKLSGQDISWQQFDWDQFSVNGAFISDSVRFGNLEIETMMAGRNSEAPVKDLPVFQIHRLSGNSMDIDATFDAGSNLSTSCRNIIITELATQGNRLQWQSARAEFNNTFFATKTITVGIQAIHFNSLQRTYLDGLNINLRYGSGKVKARISSAEVILPLSSTDFSMLHIPSITIVEPKITIDNSKRSALAIQPVSVPFDLSIESLQVRRANVAYHEREGDNPATYALATDLHATKIHFFKEDPLIASIYQVSLSAYEQSVASPGTIYYTRSINLMADGVHLREISSANESMMQITGSLKGNWSDFSLRMNMPENNAYLQVNSLSGILNPTAFLFSSHEKVNWINWAQQIVINDGRVVYTDAENTISAGNITWDPGYHTLQVNNFKYEPKMLPEEYFSKSKWQSDFVNFSSGNLSAAGIDLNQLFADSDFVAEKIEVSDPVFYVWRDKRIPFQHGIEKLMPTSQMLAVNGQSGFRVDSVLMKNGNAYYHEFSGLTNQMGIVPVRNINAVITNIKSMDITATDTLTIRGSMELFGSQIKKVTYQESYYDTLSSFHMAFIGTPMQLTGISQVSKPLAAIQVNSGICNTLAASISGNKHAAFGELKFYYHDLNVSLLDHHDSLRNRIDLAFANLITNKFVLKTNNRKKSTMFFIRDRERFVFNYWAKTVISGVLTSSGVKRDKKYYRTYQDLRQVYNLPEVEF